MNEDTLIRVGNKDVSKYLQAIAIKLRQGAKEVTLLAFGDNIKKADYLCRLAETMNLRLEKIERVTRTLKSGEGERARERKIGGFYFRLVRD